MRSLADTVLLLALRLTNRQALAPFCDFLMQPGARLAEAPGRPTQAAWQQAHHQARALQTMGIAMLTVSELPARLREARPLAPLMFVRGDSTLLHAPAVAVVGSRAASAGAVVWAADYAASQARAGLLVVSGGARGIDAAAHAGALAAGGRTLAYVGCAADCVYPQQNRALFARILERGGAIVSEHPPGTESAAWHHAARNRFIAAHGHTLVVVEAAEKSGTLGTARWAHRLGRTLQVPPEGVARHRSGIDMLVREGVAQVVG